MSVNPYGYVSDRCSQDYLKVSCSSTAQELVTTNGPKGSKDSPIEQAAKTRLAAMQADAHAEENDHDRLEAQESEVKAKMTSKAPTASSSTALSSEREAKERLAALESEL